MKSPGHTFTRLATLGGMLAATLAQAGPHATSGYPQDNVLTFSDLQAKGTHNSYHVQSWVPVPSWQYTNVPLDQQLGDQGVRQFELDMHYNARASRFEVYHVPWFDQRTTCLALTDCLRDLKSWSDQHPTHHPLVVLLETKDYSAPVDPADYGEWLETELLLVWPPNRIIMPDEVQLDAPTLNEGVRTYGWPSLGELRGRILFVLHDTGEIRDAYTHGDSDLDGQVMFVESSEDDPFGAFLILNSPVEDFDRIQQAVADGFLVRTRSDSFPNHDAAEVEAALESGAQFVSTDYPVLEEGEEYWLEIPGGTPSRCNPVVAPSTCTSTAIEDPNQL